MQGKRLKEAKGVEKIGKKGRKRRNMRKRRTLTDEEEEVRRKETERNLRKQKH